MKTTEFENGSKVNRIEVSSKVIRGKRSEIISFWCDNCQKVHVEVPLSEMCVDSNNRMVCRASLEEN